MVGGVRPSRCPRAMGNPAGKSVSVDWTNLALANYYYDPPYFVIPTSITCRTFRNNPVNSLIKSLLLNYFMHGNGI